MGCKRFGRPWRRLAKSRRQLSVQVAHRLADLLMIADDTQVLLLLLLLDALWTSAATTT